MGFHDDRQERDYGRGGPNRGNGGGGGMNNGGGGGRSHPYNGGDRGGGGRNNGRDYEEEVIEISTNRLYVHNLSWRVTWQDLKAGPDTGRGRTRRPLCRMYFSTGADASETQLRPTEPLKQRSDSC
jgi:hypothetical protein